MAGSSKAFLIYEDKRVVDGGYILEGRIWRVPKAVLGSEHPYKYSLFFGRGGERLVLYDNERQKGDHRHYGDREESYRFESLDRLLRDFMADVARVAGRPHLFDREGD